MPDTAASRVAQRNGFTQAQRLRLLESDLDEQDSAIDRLVARLEALAERWDGRFNRVLWAMIGLLISLTTASILLAANLVAGG